MLFASVHWNVLSVVIECGVCILSRLIKVLIYTTVPCKVLEYILRPGDPYIKIATCISVNHDDHGKP